ncbi:chitin-binding lectin 1-like isoform X2 [Cryptotermes secundus]|uniref:chitin-binding lectin 1-like isoform X2 n=1 Tax=Cryptotermes secundus TaxID=105785 RepID=UPI001454DD77|nr:chitin-binding lectin 1-like isoform X2 [Cryptotermes secundus]
MEVLFATCIDFILADPDLSLVIQDGKRDLKNPDNFTMSYTVLANADNFTVYDEQGSATKEGTPKLECTPGERPDPVDCSKYYWCVEKPAGTFVEYHEDCPGDLVYNPHTRLCVSSDSFNCLEKIQYPPSVWYPPPPPPYWPPPPPPPYWPPPPPPPAQTTTTTTPRPPTCIGYGFICTSQTTFTMCAEPGRPFASDITCPQGYFCNDVCAFPCLQYVPNC